MSANFFKINHGINLDPQYINGSGDPVGTDGDIYYNQVLDKFRKFEAGFWSDLGGGTGSSPNSRSGEAAIPAAATSLVVTFSTPVSSPIYVAMVDMVNLVDTNPQFQ